MSETIDLKPYRTALEALVSHLTPAKISVLLGKAAANLDDPYLRDILLNYIEILDYKIKKNKNDPLKILGDLQFTETRETLGYIQEVIDANEVAWQVIGAMNNYTLAEQIADLEAELDRPVLTIAPCMTVDVPGVEPVWVLIGDNINAVEREILLYLGAKSINESSGPLVFDCPVWMFELATNTKDKKWRDECVQYWMSREETDLT